MFCFSTSSQQRPPPSGSSGASILDYHVGSSAPGTVKEDVCWQRLTRRRQIQRRAERSGQKVLFRTPQQPPSHPACQSPPSPVMIACQRPSPHDCLRDFELSETTNL
ncbi:hypothetical protein J6590_106107 [Homalodisca vitripennis]|nr:hypothetical protein J6590_106107 [Homalodisca vitripennis]